MTSIRLAHLSDIHVTADRLGWRWPDWFNKRFASWANLRFGGRGKRFRHADAVLTRLMDELAVHGPDHVIFSGDASALGFEAEFRRVADLLRIEGRAGLAVPGNHDYCTRAAAASGAFERVFVPWQQGARIDGHIYPFAQRVGPFWLVAVNSARGNRWFWDASGAVGPAQRERLRRLLTALPPGPRILVTHYPLCLADRSRESRAHGLHDLEETVAVAAAGGVCLWLHGHRHGFYWFQDPPFAPFPAICGGSSTQERRWSYGDYVIDGNSLSGTRWEFEPSAGEFKVGETFSIRLPFPD